MAASKVTTDQCTNTIAPVFWKHCRSRVSNWTPQELFYGHTVSNWKLTNRKYILQHVIDSKLRQTSFPYQQKPTRKSPELYEDSNSSTKQTIFPVVQHLRYGCIHQITMITNGCNMIRFIPKFCMSMHLHIIYPFIVLDDFFSAYFFFGSGSMGIREGGGGGGGR